MYRDPRFITPNGPPTHAYDVGESRNKIPAGGHFATVVPTVPIFGALLAEDATPNPVGGFEFQPLEMCPKSFIIFDQTNHTNRVMFHPALVHNFGTPNKEDFETQAVKSHKNVDRGNDNQDRYETSREDSDDIDALLSSEEIQEEEEDDNDSMVSTGRTPGENSRVSTTDSYYSSKDLNSADSCSTKRERDRMNGLVEALRSIIPGGDELDASTFLDEAIKYLSSVKVEMEELGVHSYDDY